MYLAGITAHNLGVVKVLSGKDSEAEPCFRQAISLKESSFGTNYPHEIALSWSELGIQLFARGDFDGALASFQKSHELEVKAISVENTTVSASYAAMALNNTACCYFQLGKHDLAMKTLLGAREIVKHESTANGAQADRDLLDVANVIGNCGYLSLVTKNYDEARSLLEEAQLIQQSVLDDNHRAIRDTRSNIEFANAFHS